MHIYCPSSSTLWIKMISSFCLLAEWSGSWVAAACMILSPAQNIQLWGHTYFFWLSSWLMHLLHIQKFGQSKLSSTCNTVETYSASRCDFAVRKKAWYFKYSTSFFYFASKRNLQCRKTMRPLPSLFWKLPFTPDSSQYTINTSSKYCSNT